MDAFGKLTPSGYLGGGLPRRRFSTLQTPFARPVDCTLNALSVPLLLRFNRQGGSKRRFSRFCVFFFLFLNIFFYRFLIDFCRFWRGCGKVLAGQSGGKIEILGALGDIMLEAVILVDFRAIF